MLKIKRHIRDMKRFCFCINYGMKVEQHSRQKTALVPELKSNIE